ncbi:uncharacterized protein [Nicotiana sylvestris]|uniref:uncharacterized protein n=1 Tax=Nicotiana sylvestris TaxID=4096 RepID=UPI00388CB110
MAPINSDINSTSTSREPTEFIPRPSSPLFLYFYDIPGLFLVPVPFSGSSFGGWRRSIIVSLSSRNKIEFIDGTFPRPPHNSPECKQWDRCNNMVISWLTSSLSPSIAESELASTNQGALEIALYFNKLKKLWDELKVIRSSHISTCTCAAKAGIRKKDEEDRLHQFLMGLNDTYVSVRSNLLMMQPPPSLDSAYNILLQDEDSGSFKFTKGRKIVANTEVELVSNSVESPVSTPASHSDGTSSVPSLTKEQYAQLISLLQQAHVTDPFSAQSSLMAFANFADHVLYVPTFHYNLISVSQLVIQLQGMEQFDSLSCILQAPSLKRQLEVGKLEHGLYRLLMSPSESTTSNATVSLPFVSNATLHCRYPLNVSDSSSVLVSKDVTFREHVFPFDTSIFLSLSSPSSSFPISVDPFDSPENEFSIPLSLPPSPVTYSIPQYSSNNPSSTLPIPPKPSIQPTRKSSRPHHLPAHFDDFVCALPPSLLGSSSLSSVVQPSSHNVAIEPQFYHQTASIPAWQEAMRKEFKALEANHTWTIVELSTGKKPIGYKWVYKIKYRADGSVERYKARLLLKGNGISSNLMSTMLFCMVTWMGRQASRQWYAKLSLALHTREYTHSLNDYSLFFKKSTSSIVLLAVYIDDIILTSDDEAAILALKAFLDDHFKIKDLGTLIFSWN